MDRRLFLTGMFGLAGAALAAGAAGSAMAMPRAARGILDDLDASGPGEAGATVEKVQWDRRHRHHHHHPRRYRPRRRRAWRTVCRRVRIHGRWRRRCWRERVWVWR